MPGPAATPKQRMAHRLKPAAGPALYRLRQQTVEPVSGIIKEVTGFQRFLWCGREKVRLERLLVCPSDNVRRPVWLETQAAAG